jgi:hypothetical protein
MPSLMITEVRGPDRIEDAGIAVVSRRICRSGNVGDEGGPPGLSHTALHLGLP